MTQRLYQKIALKLKTELSKADNRIGDKLASERELAEQYNVSRTVIREAIILLEIEGWIDVKKGSGIYLKRLPKQSLNLDEDIKDDDSLSDIGVFELLQARQVLESTIAGVAAKSIRKNDIVTLERILAKETEVFESIDLSDELDQQFHLAIAESTQNSLLYDWVLQAWQIREQSPMWKCLHDKIEDKSYRRQWLEDHQLILKNLKLKNATKSRDAMWQHLENVKEKLLLLSDIRSPDFDGYLFGYLK